MPISIWNLNAKEIYIGNQKIKEVYIGREKVYSSYYIQWEFDDFVDIQDISSRDKGSNQIWVKDGKLQVKAIGRWILGNLNYTLKKRDTITIKCQLNNTDAPTRAGISLNNRYNKLIISLYSEFRKYPTVRCGNSVNSFPQIPLSTLLILTIKINDNNYEVILKKEDGQEIMRDSSNEYMQWDFFLQFFNSDSNTMLIDYIRLER